MDSSTTSGGAKTTVYFNSISAMPAYQGKSVEELRFEDYQASPPLSGRSVHGMLAVTSAPGSAVRQRLHMVAGLKSHPACQPCLWTAHLTCCS